MTVVHLHVHSTYSLRDAMIRIDELVDKTDSLNMSAVAITEHGHVCSAFAFQKACLEKGIKPIVGCEAYVVWDINTKIPREKKQHFTLLAKNKQGYQNLMALCSIAATEGFYYTPRIDFNILEKYKEGLIAMSACSYRSVLYLYDESDEWASRIARKLWVMFGDDFYLEIMPHQLDFQKEHNLRVLHISEDQNIPLVVTQDSHYLEPSDSDIHDVLMAMQDRDPYGIDTLFFPTQDETLGMFKDHNYLMRRKVFDAIDMTEKIAEQVEDYGLKMGVFQYPEFTITDEMMCYI